MARLLPDWPNRLAIIAGIALTLGAVSVPLGWIPPIGFMFLLVIVSLFGFGASAVHSKTGLMLAFFVLFIGSGFVTLYMMSQ